VFVSDHEALLLGEPAARRDLVVDALRPLVLGAVAGVDGGGHGSALWGGRGLGFISGGGLH
jgi:hypothetical protein